MSVPPALLQALSRSRLNPLWARAASGFGERRTRAKGAGMEFADHRAYQPGDDLRHLDPHLHARLGENFVRQYEVHRQLAVTILIDASRSMAVDPRRIERARELAALLGFAALAGGDTLKVGVCRAGAVTWSPRWSGPSRANAMQGWIESGAGAGEGSFAGCLKIAAQEVGSDGLTIVLSDWWDGPDWDLGALAARGQEVWAVQILLPEELDPARLGEGAVRMVDSETGVELDLTLDPGAIERFRHGLEAWRDRLRAACTAVRGRCLSAPVEAPLAHLVLRDWRAAGILG